MRVSMKDVAARAGVSLGTVSNVVNRPDTVRPTTRSRVEAAIAELGFVRNENARQLAAGRSRTLAYVCLDAGNPFFTDVMRGVETAARQEGLALYLCNSDGDAERETEYLEHLREQRVRGVLITAVDYDNPLLTALPAAGIPVVLVDRAGNDQWCSVGVDDVLGGKLAAAHLTEQGHERIAFVGGPPHIIQISDRLAGARKAIVDAGLSPDALTVLQTTRPNVEGGRDAGERLLGLPASSRPTAVFCANDLLALGVLQTLVQHGVAVPDDVAIVGYDDIIFAEAAAIPLSSVRQPRAQLGEQAAKLLLHETESAEDHEHEQVLFAPELVVRSSSRA